MQDRNAPLPRVDIHVPWGNRQSWQIRIDGNLVKGVRSIKFEADAVGIPPAVTLCLDAEVVFSGDVQAVFAQNHRVARCTRLHSDEAVSKAANPHNGPVRPGVDDPMPSGTKRRAGDFPIRLADGISPDDIVTVERDATMADIVAKGGVLAGVGVDLKPQGVSYYIVKYPVSETAPL